MRFVLRRMTEKGWLKLFLRNDVRDGFRSRFRRDTRSEKRYGPVFLMNRLRCPEMRAAGIGFSKELLCACT
jgi:hypothetical protein